MYSLLDELDNPDVIQMIEQEFLHFADAFPMWHLLSAWEQWENSTEPPAPQVQVYEPVQDHRLPQPRELISSPWNDQVLFLQPWSSRRIIGLPPEPGVPLVRDEEGQLHLYVVHLFSGRRRSYDLHDYLPQYIDEHFPGVTLHVLSIDTAVQSQLCMLCTWQADISCSWRNSE